MTTVSSTFSSPSPSADPAAWPSPGRASYYRRRGTNAPNRPLVHCQGHQPSTGGYGLRVMPAAPSREPSARRAWSIRSARPSWAGARGLAARTWSGHRLFIIVLTPAVLLRVDAELGYRWQAWFNDSFEYVQNTVHFQLDPTRVSGYSIWLKILQPLHTYALVTILQHLMGLAVAVMIYALARHRFGAPAWLATLATVPVLYDGFEIQLEHLIMADVPFLFLLTLAITLLLWDPGPSTRRCVVIGALLGIGAIAAVDRPAAARGLRRVHDHPADQLAEGRGHHRGVPHPGGRLRGGVRPGARPVRDERQHRRVPLLPGDDASPTAPRCTCPPTSSSLCTTVPPAQRPIAQAYIWTSASPLDRFPPSKFSPVPNQLAKNFAIRAIEAQPLELRQGGVRRHLAGVRLEADRLPQRRDLRRVHLRLPLAADPGLG